MILEKKQSIIIQLEKNILNKYWRIFLKQKFLFFLLLPGIVYFVIFHYVPLYGILLAFKKYIPPLGIVGSPWVGLYQFERIISMPASLNVIANTLIISVQQIVFGFPAPIILALLLNELRNMKLKRTIQTISYLPHFLAWTVISAIVIEVLSPSRGLYGYLSELLHYRPIVLMQSKAYWRTILIVTSIWKEVGWGTIIYLASIAGIDSELYEAADIDGAARLKKVLYITLPGLMPVVTIMLIFRMSGLLNVGFDPVFNLYNPAVFEVAEVLSTYTYRVGLAQSDFSFSTAIGLANNIVAFILLVATNQIAKRVSETSLW